MGGRRKFPEIEIDHGVIMLKGKNQPLNYLWGPEGRGIYEPNYGLCPDIVTREVMEEHNKLLDQMLVTGLDESCEVGQGGMFYFSHNKETGKYKVATFMGTLISDEVRGVTERCYYFTRKGKEFRGTRRKNSDLTFVKRIKGPRDTELKPREEQELEFLRKQRDAGDRREERSEYYRRREMERNPMQEEDDE